MALWHGTVQQLTGAALPSNRRPLVRFRPSGPASISSGLLTTAVVEVEPATDGSFEVELADFTSARPAVWLTVEVAWFDEVTTADGKRRMVGVDVMPWRFIPAAWGGDIGDAIDASPAAWDVWVWPTPHANRNRLWLDTTNGRLKRWV
ncbi:hypothetical protein GCM10011490_24320 [Pseudoclavibacter endophyticus]|uniref:Uncharacterized protein n=1 Tax=Pseudoclavibacter endophyticus TaxID=1778590 RepID=A0A6H9WCL0_9MICO|nr:hypothetical protein [Pseudoclavibacter endophyticus]KAB1648433.1 hypothetical protein F8O04_12165 [Pseudoclavibacter endophyticus]GGA72679.1 hypothetical protein GCM10011490_24320 [Pseudoclavibacter endophyticus]